MSGFDENPFAEPAVFNPFAVSHTLGEVMWNQINDISL